MKSDNTWPRYEKCLHLATLLLLLLGLLSTFYYMSDARALSDESFNFRQITRFLNGDWSLEPTMNAIPGYQAVVALVMKVFGKRGIFSARLVSTGISYAGVLVFYLLTWKLYGRPSLVKTLQFALFPLLFPFFPLVYMDILGLVLVLLALYLVLWRRNSLAGLVGILSILARTNNIAWFAFLFVWVVYDHYALDWSAKFWTAQFWRPVLQKPLELLRLTWAFWLGFVAFALFLILNKGIALSDNNMQPLFKFSLGNLYYDLFLFAFLFLPLNLANVGRIGRLLWNRKWVLPALLLLFGLYFLTFHPDHPWNLAEPDYYPRNQLLMLTTDSNFWRAAFFLPVAFGLLALAVTRLREQRFYWLYPFTLLGLLPFWLIEPRYAFVPFSLYILFKGEQSPLVEWLVVGLYALVAVPMLVLLKQEYFFI